MPGLLTAVATVPAITRPCPSLAAMVASLSTPFCSDKMVGTSWPLAISSSRAVRVSNDLSANTPTSYGPAANASAAESCMVTLRTTFVPRLVTTVSPQPRGLLARCPAAR